MLRYRPLISSPLCTFSKQGASFVSCAYANFFVRPASCLFSLCAGTNRRVVLRMGVPHREGLDTHAGLESCVAILPNSDTFSFRLLEGVASTRPRVHGCRRFLAGHCVTKINRFACVSNPVQPEWFRIPASQMLCVPCSAATVRLSIVFNASHSHMPGFRRNA